MKPGTSVHTLSFPLYPILSNGKQINGFQKLEEEWDPTTKGHKINFSGMKMFCTLLVVVSGYHGMHTCQNSLNLRQVHFIVCKSVAFDLKWFKQNKNFIFLHDTLLTLLSYQIPSQVTWDVCKVFFFLFVVLYPFLQICNVLEIKGM